MYMYVRIFEQQSDSPPRTSPFVQMADMESVVTVVTTPDRMMMTIAWPIPACPTTHDRRRKIMTPKMLSRHRICSNNARVMAREVSLQTRVSTHKDADDPPELGSSGDRRFVFDGRVLRSLSVLASLQQQRLDFGRLQHETRVRNLNKFTR